MATYAVLGDLLTGNIPMPAYLDPAKYLQDAADEIDSKIGHVYVTPIDVNSSAVTHPTRLLLKRINAHLASGRLLMAAAASAEQQTVHAYAERLVKESQAALCAIAEGKVKLEGATVIQIDAAPTVPLIYNKDLESHVDAFYDRLVAPTTAAEVMGYPRIWP